MFYFKETADPVGNAQVVEPVEKMVSELKMLWDSQRSRKSMFGRSVNMSMVTNFLMCSLDGLVNAVKEAVIAGPDKKATVLEAIDRLYDYTVREALPFWMRPIAAPIKQYIVYVLVSNAIDWIVAKYKNGSWKNSETTMDRVLMLADRRMVLCKSACRARRQK